SLAGGRERGRPAGRGAVGRDQCFSGEHPVGLFADRTRLELILQRTLRIRETKKPRDANRAAPRILNSKFSILNCAISA
ncbi:MAG TPA: hypothetical protein VKE51_32025, partial [Vicinamibacterales bacterium]|nr:hypothetical protein [Vicinamibacterales bacterium]